MTDTTFTIISLTIHPHQSIHDFSPIIFISSWKSEHILILKLHYMNLMVTVYHTETGDLKSYSITKSYFSSVIMVLILTKHGAWPGWHPCSNETMWQSLQWSWMYVVGGDLHWHSVLSTLHESRKVSHMHAHTYTHKSLVNVTSLLPSQEGKTKMRRNVYKYKYPQWTAIMTNTW